VTRRNASRTTWRARVLFICCVSAQDTGRYERHISTGSRRLPIRDERYLRDTPAAGDARHGVAGRLQLLRNCWTVLPSTIIFTKFDLKVHGFERVSLATEWLIIGDRTKAADFTTLWKDLHKSISVVKGAKSQSWTGHFWTHCR
jgi:hypothetical protein